MSKALSLSSLANEIRNWIESSLVTLAVDNEEERFNRLALELWALQVEQNAAYSHFCQRHGVMPSKVGQWRDIPALPTTAFKQLEVTSVPAGERFTNFLSSGTTGQQPSRHWHNHESLALYEASAWAWFTPHLLPATDRLVEWTLLSLTPSPAVAPQSSLVHMMAVIRRQSCQRFEFVGQIGSNGEWEIDYPRTVQILDLAVLAGRPVLLLGTAFSFVHLLDALDRDGTRFDLPPGSRIMETGGYKGRSRTIPRAELHESLRTRFAIPEHRIVCEYGMSELSSQAYDLAAPMPSEMGHAGSLPSVDRRLAPDGVVSRVFRFPPWARACVLSPEDDREVSIGETGLLRIVDLANVWSVQAVQTEDLAIRRDNGFELLGRAARSENRGCSLMTGDLR